MIVDIATCIYHEQCSENDRGLRKAIVKCVRMRMLAILEDKRAWEDNLTTSSVFTNFALRIEVKKELMINQLLDLFIAADKVAALLPLFFIFMLTSQLVQP